MPRRRFAATAPRSPRPSSPTGASLPTSPKLPCAIAPSARRTTWRSWRDCRASSLRGRRDELAGLASRERSDYQRREALAKRIERAEAISLDPGARGRHAAEALERYRAEMDTLAPIREEARRELAAVEEELASRERLATAAVCIAAPPYILSELGQRPANPAEAKAWDRGVSVIETYRRDNGVSDRTTAFGPEPKGGAAKARQHKAMERTARLQRQLREVAVRKRVLERSAERSMGIGR